MALKTKKKIPTQLQTYEIVTLSIINNKLEKARHIYGPYVQHTNQEWTDFLNLNWNISTIKKIIKIVG